MFNTQNVLNLILLKILAKFETKNAKCKDSFHLFDFLFKVIRLELLKRIAYWCL